MQHRDRAAIDSQDVRPERRVALIEGPSREPGEQGAAQSDSLPVVRDGSGELDHTRLTGYLGVARDGDSSARDRIDREQCLTVVVIDVHQAVKRTLRHMRFGSAEPQIPRLVRKSSDCRCEQSTIAPLEGAHVDDTSVTQLYAFNWLTGHDCYLALRRWFTRASGV